MKKKYLMSGWFVLLLLLSLVLGTEAYAKPERMPLKSDAVRTEEQLAKNNLKTLETEKIKDPEARKAIREILRYLGLEKKN